VRRVTTGDSDDVVPSWSRDGRWVYFVSNRSGENQVWKVPAEGGEAVQVTRKEGSQPLSPSTAGTFTMLRAGMRLAFGGFRWM